MSVEFKTDAFRTSLNDLHASLRNNAAQLISAATTAAYESAKRTPLFKDGTEARLRNSIRKEMRTAFDGRVIAGGRGVPEAKFVENGTPPHDIRARGNGALRFVMNGEVIYRRVVHHPGTAERPFMAEAAKVGEQTLDYGADIMFERPIAKFNNGG